MSLNNQYKHIVLFSDGTGNSAGKLFKTNVWRTYQAVDVSDPTQASEPRQVAFYNDGVGTSSFKPLAFLGGAMGFGLERNVREIYAFLCRNYQPGDKIYAFGFSRGAFTVRVLVDLILKQGLVPYAQDEAELKRLVSAAYRAYRAASYPAFGGVVRCVRRLRDAVIAGQNRVLGQVPYAQIQTTQVPFIQFLGLWDTVDAYGLPVDELTRAIDRYIWPLLMPDLVLDPRVLRARHALSVDDERNAFHPRLWNEAQESQGGNTLSTHIDQERISQVWFAGMHSDVGGGYPDDGLAYVSLAWIMGEAAHYGLRFCNAMRDQYRALADDTGPIHNSRRGLGGYYRYNPRRIEALAHQDQEKKTHVRVQRSKIHESVLRRIQTGHDGYAPFVLPPSFAVMKFDGHIVRAEDYLGPPVASPAFAQRHEQVWNWVWWRRVAYFFTVFMTLVLVVMPLAWPALPKGACTSRWCFTSHAIDLVAVFLPPLASTWTDAFASHPSLFLGLAFAVGVGLWAGSVLQRRVGDAMRAVWSSALSQASPSDDTAPWRAQGRLNQGVAWLRTRPLYATVGHFLSWDLGPFLFLLALAYGALAGVSQVTFAVRSSWGSVCTGSASWKAVTPDLAPIPWSTRNLCTATGVALQKGATYRLRVSLPASDPWRDGAVPAGPNGVDPNDATLAMILGVPLRRHLGQPWFKPMARIQPHGTDVYPLNPQPSVPVSMLRSRSSPEENKEMVFETEFVARTSGELFVYVNDAVLQIPFYPESAHWFYANNGGSSQVQIVWVQAPLPPPGAGALPAPSVESPAP